MRMEENGIGIEYATDLFEAETIERLAAHFKELIQGIIEDSHQVIETLPLLTYLREATDSHRME